MLGASYSLEISQLVCTKQRNSEDTDEGSVSVSSKDASRSGVLTFSGNRVKKMLQVLKYLVQKGVVLTPSLKWEVG